MSSQADPVDLLRARGVRVTAARLAVLASLADLPPHVTVDQVEQAARRRLGALSTQAVYDILRALHEAGLVRRIEPAGSPALFETRVGDNHHHLVCRDCGRTVDVECEVAAAPCLTPSDAAGFEIDEAEVIFWGRCEECAAERKRRRESSDPRTTAGRAVQRSGQRTVQETAKESKHGR